MSELVKFKFICMRILIDRCFFLLKLLTKPNSYSKLFDKWTLFFLSFFFYIYSRLIYWNVFKIKNIHTHIYAYIYIKKKKNKALSLI